MAQPRQPPELTADLIGEIVLRLPPDDPACLVRASLACKLWRGVISDRSFPGRYRAFHRTAPVLGFFKNLHRHSGCIIPRFVRITASSSPPRQPEPGSRGSQVIDCRHGRVLLRERDIASHKFSVWDPITGHRKELHWPSNAYGLAYSATVLCGADGCDHLDCHAGPFLVVLVSPGRCLPAWCIRACVYSSKTGAWGAPAFDFSDDFTYFPNFTTSSVLIGDEIYSILTRGTRMLKYDMGKHYLSMIDSPDNCGDDILLMPMEDGSLGFAEITSFSLYLWSRRVNSDGVARWMQCRVIELQKLIPSIKYHIHQARVVGFAEGVGVIFVSSDAGTFAIELKSGRVRKINKWRYDTVFPFLSFYTPDCSSTRLPCPAESD